MKTFSRFKFWFIGAALLACSVVAYLIYALAGFTSKPVKFDVPPPFVQQYANALNHPDFDELEGYNDYYTDHRHQSTSDNITDDYSRETALLHSVIFDGQSPDLALELFGHPDKRVRVKMASAFAEMNIKYSHDEESGYPDKRRKFWKDWASYLPNMENALFEAVVTSAKEGTLNYIPYTLAWMPTQDQDTVELLTWAAEHHPDPWVRRFSVYFVVKFGGNETMAKQLLESRVDDPAYIVRKQVLDLKYERLTGQIDQS